MRDTHRLLKALESIAYDEDENDVMHSLDVIREEVADSTTDSLPLLKQRKRGTKKQWDPIKTAAHGLLASASQIAWSKRKDKKRAIMRVAASYMGQNPVRGETQERDLECLFVVRAVWRRDRPALELVGPVNARPRFLISYAFWLVAKSEPPSVWRRTERKHCPVCKNVFSDNGGSGRPKTYCGRECYTIAHAMMDKRSK